MMKKKLFNLKDEDGAEEENLIDNEINFSDSGEI